MRLQYLTPFRGKNLLSEDSIGWPNIFSLHRELDRMFDQFIDKGGGLESNSSIAWSPKANISETADHYQISAELPGVEEKDVEVTLDEGVLLIKGTRQSTKEQKDRNYHRKESLFGQFERSFQLPDAVQADKIEAKFKNGMLDIQIPKMAEIKAAARKISIKNG